MGGVDSTSLGHMVRRARIDEGTSNRDFDRYRSDFWSRASQWALAAREGGQEPPTIEG